MRPLEIDKMLMLSTAHVTKEIAEIIDSPRHTDFDWTPGWRRPEGWIFCVRDGVHHKDMPKVLKDVLAFAALNGCLWVMFDCDGPIIDELAKHDW